MSWGWGVDLCMEHPCLNEFGKVKTGINKEVPL